MLLIGRRICPTSLPIITCELSPVFSNAIQRRGIAEGGVFETRPPSNWTGFWKLIYRFIKLLFWNGRHMMLPGKEQMRIVHPSSPAFSNTYVACCYLVSGTINLSMYFNNASNSWVAIVWLLILLIVAFKVRPPYWSSIVAPESSLINVFDTTLFTEVS